MRKFILLQGSLHTILESRPFEKSLLFNWTSHTNGNIIMNSPKLQEPTECVHTFPFWDNGRNFMKLVNSSEFEYKNLMEWGTETIQMTQKGSFRYCGCEKFRCKYPCNENVISGWDMYNLYLYSMTYTV